MFKISKKSEGHSLGIEIIFDIESIGYWGFCFGGVKTLRCDGSVFYIAIILFIT